jgi:hypothetical protein
MENSITTKRQASGVMTSESDRSDEKYSELDILRKAYEIYLENSTNFSDELWSILRGEIPAKESGR